MQRHANVETSSNYRCISRHRKWNEPVIYFLQSHPASQYQLWWFRLHLKNKQQNHLFLTPIAGNHANLFSTPKNPPPYIGMQVGCQKQAYTSQSGILCIPAMFGSGNSCKCINIQEATAYNDPGVHQVQKVHNARRCFTIQTYCGFHTLTCSFQPKSFCIQNFTALRHRTWFHLAWMFSNTYECVVWHYGTHGSW